MIYEKKYPYETLERKTDEQTGIRHYKTPLGWVPSVTTILSQTGDKSGLHQWIDWVGEKKAEQIRNEAAALGNIVHENMEAHLFGQDRPSGSNFIYQLGTKMSDILIEKGFSQVDEIWGIEEALFMNGLYAGTSDLIGVHNGTDAILDWKNTIKMKKRKHLDGYFMQGTAYLMAHNEMFGTNIRKVSIMMVDRDLDFECFEIEGSELEYFKKKWIEALEEYYA